MAEVQPMDDVEKKVLLFVGECLRDEGAVPTLQRISDKFKWSSTRAAGYRLERLEEKGWIRRRGDGWKTLEILDPTAGVEPHVLGAAKPLDPIKLPYLHDVSCSTIAGSALDDSHEEIDLAKVLKTAGALVFRAKGKCMEDAHIAEGDLLVVDENPDPPQGSIVIVVMGEDLYCKRFVRKDQWLVWLRACRGKKKPFAVDIGQVPFRFVGVLRNVVRKV